MRVHRGLGAAGDDDVGVARAGGARRRWRCDSVLDAQADDIGACERAGLEVHVIAAAAAFGMSIGTVIGSTRRGPLLAQRVPGVEQGPDAADAGGVVDAEALGGDSGEPASAHASLAEISANWLDGSRRFATGRSSTSSGRTFASAAKVTGSSYLATQSCSSERAPDSPASRAFQLSGAVPPSGEVAPMPVTTIFLVIRETLRWRDWSH